MWARLRNFPNIPLVKSIPYRAFYACSFNTLNIPDYITHIEPEAFYYSGIRNLTIPSTVKEIGYGAFNNNYITSGEYIYARNLDGSINNNKLVSFGKRIDEIATIPSSVKELDKFLNLNVNNIPNTVTNISEGTFWIRNTGTITIPGSIKNIPKKSFTNSSAAKFIFNDGVSTIDSDIFGDNYTISDIELPSSITNIKADAFLGLSGIKKIKINKSPNSIPNAPWGAYGATIEWNG